MNRIKCFLQISVFILVMLLNFSCYGQQIFVSPEDGNDSWSGKLKAPNASKSDGPVATLEQAKKLIKALQTGGAKDTVYINLKGGYHELTSPLIISPEDVNNKNVVIQSMPGEKAIITSSRGIQMKPVPGKQIQELALQPVNGKVPFFEQLYLDGDMLQRAREPNSGFLYTTKPVREDTLLPGKQKDFPPSVSQYYLKSNQLDAKLLQQLAALPQADLRSVLVSILYKWTEKKVYMNKVDQNDGRIVTQPRNGMKDFVQWSKGIQFYMENSSAFLDSSGEWFLDKTKGKLYYDPRDADKGSVELRAPLLETLISLKGADDQNKVKNITIRNVVFAYSALYTPKDGFVNQQTMPYVSASLTMNYADNISINNCEFRNLSNNAVWFKTGCSNSSITNCYLHDLGAGAIKIGDYQAPLAKSPTKKITVDNNLISGGGKILVSAPAVAIYLSSDNRITHNDISNFKYSGISNGFTWSDVPNPNSNNYIGYNKIYFLGWGIMDDLAGIYSVGNSEGSKIEFNVIHDVYCYRYGANGIYLDQGSAGLTINNNTVYNCESAGFMCGHAKETLVTNNIFAFNKDAQVYFGYAPGEKAPQLKFVKNIIYWDNGKLLEGSVNVAGLESNSNSYWMVNGNKGKIFNGVDIATWRKQTGQDANSMVVDPQFKSPVQRDFTLRAPQQFMSTGKRSLESQGDTDAGIRSLRPEWKASHQLPADVKASFNRSVSIKSMYNSRY